MTEPRFGPGAARLSGHAAQLLGWRPGEFWQSTPAELAAALVPPPGTPAPFDRTDLTRMMEQDHA